MKLVSRWKKRLCDERGSILVLAALSMTALMGFVALGTDIGLLFRAKRNIQIAADSAAVAGALDYLYNRNTSSAIGAGQAASSTNGLTDGSGGVSVAVSTPPADGPNAGSTGFVEAVVSQPRNTYFMAMFGFRQMTVSARAVAGSPAAGNACAFFKKAIGTDLALKGSASLSANCGFYGNSTTSDGVTNNDTGAGVYGPFLGMAGTPVLGSPMHSGSVTITDNAAPRRDPFGNLTGPNPNNPSDCTTTDTTAYSKNSPLGSVTAGAGNTMCFTNKVYIGTATLGPGTYVFANGVQLLTNTTTTVNSGTLDIYGGTFSQDSNSILNITSPQPAANSAPQDSGSRYDNIALMQPANNTNDMSVQFGSSNQTFSGYIYAPTANLTLHDNGGGVKSTGFVVGELTINSSNVSITSYDLDNPGATSNRLASLVE
jgi:hypothetical protein